METFGSAEIWNLRASFMLVGTDAKADIPLPDTVRRYFFAGVTHGGGRGGFSSAGDRGQRLRAAGESGAERADAIRVDEGVRRVGDDWRADAAEPIPDDCRRHARARHRRGDGHFRRFPGDLSPVHAVRCSTTIWAPGSTTRTPPAFSTRRPKIKRSLPQLVVKVDADGNEVAGVKSPLHGGAARHLHRLERDRIGSAQRAVVRPRPAVSSRSRRRRPNGWRSGDPRPSLEERYRSHDEYVQVVSAAAAKLVQERYLLQQDADAMIKQAEASDVLR